MKNILGTILLVSMGVATPSFATTYWVSATEGGSGDCSSAVGDSDPGVYLGSITDGLACVGPAGTELGAGNTVIVKDGVYDETLANNIPSGAADDQRFTLMAENPGGAVLQPTSATGSIIYVGVDTHYLTINGLVLDGSNSLVGGLAFSSYDSGAFYDIVISQMEVRNIDTDGMDFENGSDFQIVGNWIHDGGACGQGAYLGYCHGMYMGANFQNSVVDSNTIERHQGYAIHFYGGDAGDTISGNVVSNNVGHDNGSSAAGEGSILIWGPNNQLYSNYSYSNAGSGFDIGYDGNYLDSNVAQNNGYSGIDVSGDNTTIVNNVLIDNAAGAITGSGSWTDSNNVTN